MAENRMLTDGMERNTFHQINIDMKGARDRTHGESTNGLYRRLLKSEIRE